MCRICGILNRREIINTRWVTYTARTGASPGRLLIVVATAIAPCLWGTTYILFTETLPTSHPLSVAALRVLPAGLLLMMIGPGLPPRRDLPRLLLLGLANIAIFSGLLLVSASRLPGGTTATLAATQPLIVILLAWPMLDRRPTPKAIGAALFGIVGVGLLVFDPSGTTDAIGVLAALGAATSMAIGTVLLKRWSGLASPLALTAWQLTLGGLLLTPVAVAIEGAPPVPTVLNLVGITALITVGTALAYWLWIRGVTLLGPDAAFLGLLSPIVATALGAWLLGEWFSGLQLAGVALIVGTTVAGLAISNRARTPLAAPASTAVACLSPAE